MTKGKRVCVCVYIYMYTYIHIEICIQTYQSYIWIVDKKMEILH